MECEENPVKVEVPIDHKAQGREHLAMVFQKFDWTKCLAVTILAKKNGKPVVAIVDIGSASIVFQKVVLKDLGCKWTMR